MKYIGLAFSLNTNKGTGKLCGDIVCDCVSHSHVHGCSYITL